MAVKKGILDNFLKPSSHYSDNQKSFRSIFIDKNEDDLKPDQQNFLESALLNQTIAPPVLERNLEIAPPSPTVSEIANEVDQYQPFSNGNTKETQRDYIIRNTKGLQREHNKNKGDTKGTIKGTHRGLQREHKNTTQKTDSKGIQREHKYSHLRGWNKKIVDLIHDICRETVSKVTYPLTNNTISEMLNMPRHSVKTTMQRLKSKGHVIVTEFNDGRGGWSRYTLPEEFFNDIPQTERVLKGATKETQRGYKGNNKGNTEGDTNLSSSSSFKDLKETTTSKLNEEWNFDITPYDKFGFRPSHIKQIAPLGIISATDVEQSLIEFSYDLDNNTLPVIKTTKINYLMWLFKNGHSYVSEGFKNEQEAMIAEMARRAEGKRRKLLEEQKILQEESFEDWYLGLSENEKNELTQGVANSTLSPAIQERTKRGYLLEYFKKNIFKQQ